jgi:hypothetical protein
MIYVVEIMGPNGGRATKEYEAPSIRAVITAAERDLRSFPQCEIVNIQLRLEWEMPVSSDAW